MESKLSLKLMHQIVHMYIKTQNPGNHVKKWEKKLSFKLDLFETLKTSLWRFWDDIKEQTLSLSNFSVSVAGHCFLSFSSYMMIKPSEKSFNRQGARFQQQDYHFYLGLQGLKCTLKCLNFHFEIFFSLGTLCFDHGPITYSWCAPYR